MKEIMEKYKSLLIQKRYSANTQRIYCHYFGDFINYFNGTNIENTTKEEINRYILILIKTHKISISQQNQRINAIKFYYEKVLNRKKQYYELHRPHKEHKLPKVLSKNEVKQIINIIGAKGMKDRISLLSDNLLQLLRIYYKEYKPKKYLFEGQKGGKYSPTSVANILKKAALKAGIKKKVTPHMLHHSFATHLLEQGTDLRYIQELLGYNSSKTTEIYTHVSKRVIDKIKNPMDDFFE